MIKTNGRCQRAGRLLKQDKQLQAELIQVIAGIHDELNAFQSNCAFLRNHVYFLSCHARWPAFMKPPSSWVSRRKPCGDGGAKASSCAMSARQADGVATTLRDFDPSNFVRRASNGALWATHCLES